MTTCTGCGEEVTYDEGTKLYHCGVCLRFGERVEWCGDAVHARRMVGTVVGFTADRTWIKWDHQSSKTTERCVDIKHLNVLDRLAEV